MGLDMYLHAERYLWPFPEDSPDIAIRNAVQEMFPELGATPKGYGDSAFEVKGIKAKVGYWRKANAIHKWFVDNVQDGVDDCGDYTVEWEQLVELRDTCKTVLENNKMADELLPPQSGFFFGGTDVDDWYLQNLQSTVDIIDRIETQLVTEEHEGTRYSKWDFSYHSSW